MILVGRIEPLAAFRVLTPSPITLSLKRADYTPSSLNAMAAKAATQVKEYRNQIIRATYLFNHEFKRNPVYEGAMCLPDVAIFYAGYRKKILLVQDR